MIEIDTLAEEYFALGKLPMIIRFADRTEIITPGWGVNEVRTLSKEANGHSTYIERLTIDDDDWYEICHRNERQMVPDFIGRELWERTNDN